MRFMIALFLTATIKYYDLRDKVNKKNLDRFDKYLLFAQALCLFQDIWGIFH